MSNPVIHLDDVPFTVTVAHEDKFEARLARIGRKTSPQGMSCNVTAVPPGKRAFPFHNHHVNDELFYILAGSGILRFGDTEHPVRPGDLISCPPGGPEVAHQLINTGKDELKYLAISTAISTDVFQYPDSGKFGVVSGREPGTDALDAKFSGFYVEDTRVSYWKDE